MPISFESFPEEADTSQVLIWLPYTTGPLVYAGGNKGTVVPVYTYNGAPCTRALFQLKQLVPEDMGLTNKCWV